ncbi:hypothetical protein A2U01_0062309, partial [Trifolium medium]|nr:hypothetical protein [Trifolium medium]
MALTRVFEYFEVSLEDEESSDFLSTFDKRNLINMRVAKGKPMKETCKVSAPALKKKRFSPPPTQVTYKKKRNALTKEKVCRKVFAEGERCKKSEENKPRVEKEVEEEKEEKKDE